MPRLMHLLGLAAALVLAGASPATAHLIAFTSVDRPDPSGFGGSDQNIWTVDADTGAGHALTEDPAEDTQPAWSPDGTRLAFTSTRSGTEAIWTMPAGGTPELRLTGAVPPVSDTDPQWSPDGRLVAFTRTTRPPGSIGTPPSAVWVIDVRTGAAESVTPGLCCARRPRWSPDGRSIAFTLVGRGDDPSSAVWVVRADGHAARRVVDSAADPRWSPDGRTLAYRGDGGIWLARSRGAAKPRLVVHAPSRAVRQTWTPDGRSLVYELLLGPYFEESQLRRVDLGTGADVALTPEVSTPPFGPLSTTPEVSPDGSRVAYVSTYVEPMGEIAVVGIDGAGMRLLTHDRLFDWDPTWQPRG